MKKLWILYKGFKASAFKLRNQHKLHFVNLKIIIKYGLS
jgi:hypothetical protein